MDTNVLFGGLHRNIALSLAEGGFYRPRWSTKILEEFERHLAVRLNDSDKAQLQRKRVETAFPEGEVEISAEAEARLTLPDDGDNHVLAAAIKARAAQIVTDNLQDFPSELLEPYEIEAISADHFFSNTISLSETAAVYQLRLMRERL
ncbi:PIN domain-containing protein [Roseovarius tolerans]|uniref:PIN domain-containing protein n=1 Tax=Roseovarius tolerans TaxID=74031 RepID=UPI001C31CF32|nr:PIN domain-containing protein [Roseovarius tolerans]